MVLSESNPSKCVFGERELEFGRSVLDLDLGTRFTFGGDDDERAFKITRSFIVLHFYSKKCSCCNLYATGFKHMSYVHKDSMPRRVSKSVGYVIDPSDGRKKYFWTSPQEWPVRMEN